MLTEREWQGCKVLILHRFFCPLRSCQAVELRCQVLIQQPLQVGRIDLDYHRSGNRTRATVNLELLSSRTAVLTSFPASVVLPRFGLVSTYQYLFPSNPVSRVD